MINRMAELGEVSAVAVVLCMSFITFTSPTRLLISDANKVWVLDDQDLSTSSLTAPTGTQVYAVDYHWETGDLYFSILAQTSGVRGVWKYDAERRESSLLLAAGTVPGIAVDWVHNNLYYIDETVYTLNVLSLDTGFTRVLYTGADTDIPRAVRVDPRDDQRYVYWTDWGDSPYIKRCGLDGNDCETLVDEDITWPNSIDIEYENNHLFWLESFNPARVYRSNLDGSEKTMMMGLSGNTRGIAVRDQGTVYVTESQTATLIKLACHPTHCEENITISGFTLPIDVQVLDPAKQPNGTDVCEGLHCPLCLPAVASTTSYDYTCYNNEGELTVRCWNHPDYCANGGVCEEVSPRIICRCTDPYVGPRCMQYREGYTPETTPTTPTTPTTTPTSTTGATSPFESSTTFAPLLDDPAATTESNPFGIGACTNEGYSCMNGASCITPNNGAPYCDCLPGYQGPSCQHRNITTYQRPWIQSVVPRYGPLAGGTRVTITGQNLDVYGVATVYLGQSSDVWCRDVFSNSTIFICVTHPADDVSEIDVAQSVLMSWQYWPDLVVLEGIMFTYKPDPSVHSLSPLQTIVSGATIVTVTGAHLDSVQQPKMKITTKIPRKSMQIEQYSACEVGMDGNEMYCATTALDLDDDVAVPSAQCKDNADCREDIEMWIGLYLDGVEQYRDLRSALYQYSRVYPYLDPQIEKMRSPVVVKTWYPHSPQAITIKGSGLSYGPLNSQYTVQVGGVACEGVEVRSDVIICNPPHQQPDIINGETRHFVNVSLGNWHQSPGYATYETSILQCTSCTIGLFIGMFVALLVIVVGVVVVMVVWKKRKQQQPNRHQELSDHTAVPSRPQPEVPVFSVPPQVSYYEDPVDYMYTNKSTKTNSFDNKTYSTPDDNDYTSQLQQYRSREDSTDSGYTELQTQPTN